ncbi:MAG: hypothetical protein ACK5D8_10405 [Bacteroidota bacterium]|jgi:hypothetical protein
MRMKYMMLCLLTISLLFASCERCITCRQYTPAGKQVMEYPEICGSKSNLLDYQDRLESRKMPGNSIECTQKGVMPWN